MKRAGLAGVFCLVAALSFYFSAATAPEQPRSGAKQSDKFSNILLHTQHGQPVRFYDDLVKDKAVVINLMFAGCGDICPANTAALARVHEALGPSMGRDVTMLSVSIDPIGDTPERLKRYWEAFGAKPGWLFLTGKPKEIERLRRELGLYDRNPSVDADVTQHSGIVTIGNDRTNRWIAIPALTHPAELATAIRRIAARPAGDAARGQADYATYCAACHGRGGDGDGPLAKELVPQPPRHSAAHMKALSDEYLFQLLKKGGPAVGKSPLMGAWGRNLSDQQILDVIAFLRTLPYR
jgi:protein SCO1